jgi:hypothetical protein
VILLDDDWPVATVRRVGNTYEVSASETMIREENFLRVIEALQGRSLIFLARRVRNPIVE